MMQHTLNYPPPVPVRPEEGPAFNVVIAYEDFEAGKQAKMTYDFLAAQLGPDCRFTNQMWKFDVLSLPRLRELAAKDVAEADIVIISCRSGDLPGHVRKWLEAWVVGPARPLALVALFNPAPGNLIDPRPLRAYLADIANRGRMEFFARPDDWPASSRRETPVAFQPRSDIGSKTLSTLAGAGDREFTYPCWGINE